jgi:hypothetical protein
MGPNSPAPLTLSLTLGSVSVVGAVYRALLIITPTISRRIVGGDLGHSRADAPRAGLHSVIMLTGGLR